jgi:hypothetical protein
VNVDPTESKNGGLNKELIYPGLKSRISGYPTGEKTRALGLQ